MKRIFLITTLITIIFACSKKDDDVKTNGDLILSSKIFGSGNNYYVEGFLFEKSSKVNFDLTSTPLPDLVLENNIQGSEVGANLTSPQNITAFYLAGSFADATEAENYFNNLTQVGTFTYTPTASAISKNQVYIFQTRGNKYAKLLIKDLTIIHGQPDDYVDATIKWVYQPDGTKVFAVE